MAENSGDAEKGTSFWKTLPGILTAISGLIGAISALLLAFHQIGFFKDDSAPTPPAGIEQPPRATLVEVPALDKMFQKEAEGVLIRRDLRVGKITPIATAMEKPGIVVKQDPAAETPVQRGTPVELWVEVQPSRPVMVEVPPVTKMYIKDADTVLSERGLRVGAITRQPSKAKPGWVFDQNPAAWTKAERNTAVDLLIATDASRTSVTVPFIPKVSQKEAEDILAKRELRVGKITTRLGTGMKPGTVVGQWPSAETPVERNSEVKLLVAK